MLWNYHDDDLPAPAANVELSIDHLPGSNPRLTHYRIDSDHSNAFEAWKKMGSPKAPRKDQVDQLLAASALQTLGEPEPLQLKNDQATLKFTLPRQGVSLLVMEW
jgi:xylan 1,4-beta-xylosidase